MRTTKQISEELESVERELERMDKFLQDGGDPKALYTFRNGHIHSEWTWDDALTSAVSKKFTLMWVLNKKY